MTSKPACYRSGRYMRWENMQGHPLASGRGRIPAHRLALWEAMGQPAESACSYCGYVLPWKAGDGADAFKDVVNVDHLDSDGFNNDPSNLVVACWWCNANREWATALIPDEFAALTAWLADVPPVHRPWPGRWVELRYGQTVDAKNRCWAAA